MSDLIKKYYTKVATIKAATTRAEVFKILSEEPYNLDPVIPIGIHMQNARTNKNNDLVYVISQAMYRLRYLNH